MKNIILGTTERHLKDNVIIRHGQHRFTKSNSCLPNLISFYGKVTCPVDEGKVVDVFSWILVRLLILFSWTNCPVRFKMFLVDELADGQGSKGRVVVNEATGPSGLNSRASPVQCIYHRSGCRS